MELDAIYIHHELNQKLGASLFKGSEKRTLSIQSKSVTYIHSPQEFSTIQQLKIQANQLLFLPKNILIMGETSLIGCHALEALPKDFNTKSLYLSDCISLKTIPETAKIEKLTLTNAPFSKEFDFSQLFKIKNLKEIVASETIYNEIKSHLKIQTSDPNFTYQHIKISK